MKSQLQQSRGLRFGVFEVDLVRQELRKYGMRIKLASQPFQAMVELLNARGEVVTRETLRNALWPEQPWGDHDQRLNSIINKIREALSDSAETPRFLETLPRVGYRFLASVEQIGPPILQEEPAPPAAAPVEPEPVEPAILPVQASTNVPAARPRLWTVIPAVATLLVLAAAFNYHVYAKRSLSFSSVVPVPLTSYVGSELYPCFSPNGRSVVFSANSDQDPTLHIFTTSVSGGGAKQLTARSENDRGPVWSSDGKRIAFQRDVDEGRAEIWLMNADGSAARRLAEIRRADAEHPLSWSAEPEWLIAAVGSPTGGPSALHLISTTTGEQRQITSAPMQYAGDLSPSVSPDGRRIVFTRATSPSWRDIYTVTLSGDLMPVQEPVRVTNLKQIVDTIAWTADGRTLLFSASTTGAGARHLFAVDAEQASPAQSAREIGVEGLHPALSAEGKLAYVQKNLEQSSVWRLELDGGHQTRLIASTRRDYTADISPNAQRLVFSSVRSGPSEIWTSAKDGSDLRRITSLGASKPRWSPDGRSVVFESNTRGQPDIYVFDLGSSAIRRVSTETGRNLYPSWSRDGRHIYFSSNATGRFQIWKVPAEGGKPVQITRSGGFYAIEGVDGKTLYYTSASRPASVWSTTIDGGGNEAQLLTHVVGYSGIAMAPSGLYYLASATESGAEIDFYDFRSRTSRRLASISRPVHSFLSSPPDGKSVLYTQVDRQDSDLMLAEGFR